MPGSRYGFAPDADAISRKKGLYVLSFDRPGYGFSDFDPLNNPVTVAKDALEFMDAMLKSDGYAPGTKFDVVGYSNVGFILNLNVVLLCQKDLIVTRGFSDSAAALNGLAPGQMAVHFTAKYAPWLFKVIFTLAASIIVNPEGYFQGFEGSLGNLDKEFLTKQRAVREFWVDQVTGETFRQGVQGFLHDIPLLFGRTSPSGFGFDIRNIDTSKVPVTVVTATEDVLVSRRQ
ncbi:hypothetical protein HDU93_003076, partial [Gonapodya sp. JEL0774]